MRDFFVRWTTLLAVLILIVGTRVSAQTDNFGAMDTVYIDSVAAAPGQTVSVRVMARTDELISSLSVPLVYNSSYLTLNEISFTGSRVEHIATRLITPSLTTSISGHFVVAVIKIAEAPMAAGDGTLFTLKFRISDTAQIGQVLAIDSLFYPPGGDLLLIENQTSSSIRPVFKSGKIAITGVNHPPAIPAMPQQVVNEGDSLKLTVVATDPDLQAVTLQMISAPTGMIFSATGNGSGTLTWVPEYVGPYSSVGSPFKVTLQASDGMTSTERDIFVQVLNRNRAPVLSAPSTVAANAGQPVSFTVAASEPDFETLTWTTSGLPDGATFSTTAPHEFNWTPPVTAGGDVTVTMVATDPAGAADTASTVISVQKITLYTLSMDTVSGALGAYIDVTVSVKNALPITGYNVLISYDPTATEFFTATKTGTRSEPFALFTVTPNDGGRAGVIRIVGAAAASGVGTPLAAGEGSLATMRFRIANNIEYSGLHVPVQFVFFDLATQNDNTLSDAGGVKIPQSEITYAGGQVHIESIGTVLIGDINLNSVAYDIGDAVYFSNYFINPAAYPFTLLQYANSDVNQDNLSATVGDLVRLVNIIVNGTVVARSVNEENLAGDLVTTVGRDATTLTYRSGHRLGAVLVELSGPMGEEYAITSRQEHMSMAYAETDSTVRILLYSLSGAAMEAGEQGLLDISGAWTVKRVDASSEQGSLMAMHLSAGAALPDQYALSQNYPNPFNPETQINFALPTGGQVLLEVFDVLGRRVTVLAEGVHPAGEHTVRWNSRTESGTAVASGVYFYRLTTTGGTFSKKMMLLK